jgi:hypothetical protein
MSNKRKISGVFPGRTRSNTHMLVVEIKNSILKSAIDIQNKKSFISHDYANITGNRVQEQCNLG